MPRKTTNVTTINTKIRRVRQPKAPPKAPYVPLGLIVAPTAYDIALYTDTLYMPNASDVDQYGRADHDAYIAQHPEQYPERNLLLGSDSGKLTPTMPDAANIDAATSTVPDISERQLARRAAKLAVSEFYRGESLPFKAAVDLRYRAAINFARFAPGSVNGTERTAAAIAAILAYCDVAPDGTFMRGSGRVPRTMLGLPHDPANPTLAAGIESGVLSRLIGVGAIAYVNGVTHGVGAELATYRIVKPKALANMQAHNAKQASGEHTFSRVIALLSDITA